MRNYENFSTRNRDALSLTCKRFGKSIVEKRVAELMSLRPSGIRRRWAIASEAVS
jgi:hypothetical protein